MRRRRGGREEEKEKRRGEGEEEETLVMDLQVILYGSIVFSQRWGYNAV
jgi:hypothetical protein